MAGGRKRKGILGRRTMGFGFHHVELETLRRWQQNIYQDPGGGGYKYRTDNCRWHVLEPGQRWADRKRICFPSQQGSMSFGFQRHCTNCLISESLQIKGSWRACPVLLLVSHLRGFTRKGENSGEPP